MYSGHSNFENDIYAYIKKSLQRKISSKNINQETYSLTSMLDDKEIPKVESDINFMQQIRLLKESKTDIKSLIKLFKNKNAKFDERLMKYGVTTSLNSDSKNIVDDLGRRRSGNCTYAVIEQIQKNPSKKQQKNFVDTMRRKYLIDDKISPKLKEKFKKSNVEVNPLNRLPQQAKLKEMAKITKMTEQVLLNKNNLTLDYIPMVRSSLSEVREQQYSKQSTDMLKQLSAFLCNSKKKQKTNTYKNISKESKHALWILNNSKLEVNQNTISKMFWLKEDDLLQVILLADHNVRLLIAQSKDLSLQAALLIAKIGNKKSCIELALNKRAKLNTQVYVIIAQRFAHTDAVYTLLNSMPTLPIEAKTELTISRSKKIALQTSKKCNLDKEKTNMLIQSMCEQSLLMLSKTINKMDQDRLLSYLKVKNKISTSLLVRARCYGHESVYIQCLSILTGQSASNIKKTLTSGYDDELISLYKTANIPQIALYGMLVMDHHFAKSQECIDLKQQYHNCCNIIEKLINRTPLAKKDAHRSMINLFKNLAQEIKAEFVK